MNKKNLNKKNENLEEIFYSNFDDFLNIIDDFIDFDTWIEFLASDICTERFSGADLVNLCNNANFLAFEENQNFEKNEENENLDVSSMTMTISNIKRRHVHLALKETKPSVTAELHQFYIDWEKDFNNKR